MPVLPRQIDAASPKAPCWRPASAWPRAAELELGATAKINNQDFTIIGMMRRADDEGTQWNEYLMYGPRAGFSWLVETDEGWSGANVLSNGRSAICPVRRAWLWSAPSTASCMTTARWSLTRPAPSTGAWPSATHPVSEFSAGQLDWPAKPRRRK
jgi:hypothetical protein